MSTTKKIGSYTEAHLVSVAEDAVGKKTKNTVVLDKEAEDRIPKFSEGGTSIRMTNPIDSSRRLFFHG